MADGIDNTMHRLLETGLPLGQGLGLPSAGATQNLAGKSIGAQGEEADLDRRSEPIPEPQVSELLQPTGLRMIEHKTSGTTCLGSLQPLREEAIRIA